MSCHHIGIKLTPKYTIPKLANTKVFLTLQLPQKWPTHWPIIATVSGVRFLFRETFSTPGAVEFFMHKFHKLNQDIQWLVGACRWLSLRQISKVRIPFICILLGYHHQLTIGWFVRSDVIYLPTMVTYAKFFVLTRRYRLQVGPCLIQLFSVCDPPSISYTWNSKQPVFYGCFNWMIQNLYIGNGCFTKHPLKTGCLGFQVSYTQLNLNKSYKSPSHQE